jgi:hypothetical protein
MRKRGARGLPAGPARPEDRCYWVTRFVARVAVDLRAGVAFLADVLRAVVFFAGDFRAVVFFAVDFLAVDFFAVDFRVVVFLAVLFLAVLFLAGDFRVVVFFPVVFFAVDRLAGDFLAVLFFAAVFLAAATVLPSGFALAPRDVEIRLELHLDRTRQSRGVAVPDLLGVIVLDARTLRHRIERHGRGHVLRVLLDSNARVQRT